jgi:hypothetical protein
MTNIGNQLNIGGKGRIGSLSSVVFKKTPATYAGGLRCISRT